MALPYAESFAREDFLEGPCNSEALALVEAIRDKMLPEVGAMLEKKTGFKSFVYGNFAKNKTMWETYGHTPRYSTQYVGGPSLSFKSTTTDEAGLAGTAVTVPTSSIRPVNITHQCDI